MQVDCMAIQNCELRQEIESLYREKNRISEGVRLMREKLKTAEKYQCIMQAERKALQESLQVIYP